METFLEILSRFVNSKGKKVYCALPVNNRPNRFLFFSMISDAILYTAYLNHIINAF
jgi:hypothetical protein